MPTYEYRCSEGHEFEIFQRMSDDPVAACPECGAPSERVLSGGGGILFKGEGFYATDYRSQEYRKKAAREKPGGKDDGGSSGSGSEAGDSGSKVKESAGSDSAASSGDD